MRLALALGFGVSSTRDGGQVVEIAAQQIAAHLDWRAVPPFREELGAGAGRIKSLSSEEFERVIDGSATLDPLGNRRAGGFGQQLAGEQMCQVVGRL